MFNIDQDDPIRAHVADLSACFDQSYLQGLLEDQLNLKGFTMVTGSTTADNPRDAETWELFDSTISSAHAEMPKGITKEPISKIWMILGDEARCTIVVTTQLNMQDADSRLSRKFSTNDRMLRYKCIIIMSFLFVNSFFATTAKVKSLHGFFCMQLFVSDKGFVKVYGIISPRRWAFPRQ